MADEITEYGEGTELEGNHPRIFSKSHICTVIWVGKLIIFMLLETKITGLLIYDMESICLGPKILVYE